MSADDKRAHDEIWRERNALNRERLEFMAEALKDFDKQYCPKVRALQDRCAAIGHVRGSFHTNGLGSCWFYCNQCGARMEIDNGN